MTGQTAPRPVGLLLGLQCTLQPAARQPGVPGDRRLGPSTSRPAPLRDPAFRDRLRRSERCRTLSRLLQDWHRMFELGDPPNYEPPADTSVARRAERAGPGPARPRLRPARRRRRPRVPLRAVPQLRRRQPRRGPRVHRPPEHRHRSRRRRRARRHDLRRQLPHDVAHAVGTRPRPRSPSRALPRAPAHAGDGAIGRPARPRRARARATART